VRWLALLLLAGCPPAPVVDAGAPIRLMALGDSLVVGCHDKSRGPEDGAWRIIVQNRLVEAGIAYEMVGSLTRNCVGTALSRNHEGWGGETIVEITQRAAVALDAFDPDVVVLVAGTNDRKRDVGPDVFRAEYAALFDLLAPRKVFVFTPPRVGLRGEPSWDDRVAGWNAQLAVMRDAVRAEAAERDDVFLVDVCDVSTVSDAVHPDVSGHGRMGAALWKVMEPEL